MKGTNIGEVDNYIRGTWSYNYKWKPPEENTIDFQVIIKKESHKGKDRDKIFTYIEKINGKERVRKYKKLILNVVYDESQDNNLNYCMKILEDKPIKYKKSETIKFNPPN